MELNIFDLRKLCGFYDKKSSWCKLTNSVYYDSLKIIDDDVDECEHVFDYERECSLNNCPVYELYKSIKDYCKEYGVDG